MNVLEFLSAMGIDPRKAAGTHGGEYWSPCPGCGGTKRFHVWPEQNGGEGSYWCRDCDKSGDAIQFLRDFRGMSYQEACRYLEKPVREMPRLPLAPRARREKKPASAFVPKKYGPPGEKWIQKAEKFVAWAHENLLENPAELSRLAGRGIDFDSVKRFSLGWNPGRDGKDLFRPREAWGLPPETKADGKQKKLWIPAGLVIPYKVDGRVARIRIRRPEDREPKKPRYYVLPGSCMAPMLIRPDAEAFVVVETELDGILVYQASGDLVGAFAMGSSSTRPDAAAAAVLEKSLCILNALDFDPAGEKAYWNFWRKTYRQVKHWPVPEGKDPGDAFKAGVDIRAWVLAGLPPRWKVGPKAFKSRGGEEKEPAAPAPEADGGPVPAAVRELAKLLARFPVSIRKTEKRLQLVENRSWAYRNWALSQKISNLVYMDPDVFAYIENHPAADINGKNLIQETA